MKNLESIFLSIRYTVEKHFIYNYKDVGSSTFFIFRRVSFASSIPTGIKGVKEDAGRFRIDIGGNSYYITMENYLEIIGKVMEYIEQNNKDIKVVDLTEEEDYV